MEKSSPTHEAAIVGDRVGDGCVKDTVGPSLRALVKLLATVTLVMAPLFISYPSAPRSRSTAMSSQE
ncbi:MAG: sodium/proton-translocating pyrophosphatase [Dehalococcoidia bacterium]|nr:sodium/proton-translocating pyrophosphatase [Dehalococcoidia bacterium]MDP7469421.1 sodium/proton-translocating pyrophosphatase [Dehalococcoidia bacterium]